MSIHVFRVSFFIRKLRPNKDGEVPIYGRIMINSKPSEFAINRWVKPEKWDNKGQQVSGTKENDLAINHLISKTRADIEKIFNRVVKSDDRVTSDAIKAIYLKKDNPDKSLIGVYELHNQKMLANVGTSRAEGTYERHQTSLKHLKKFIKDTYGKSDIYLEDLNLSFVEELYSFLENPLKLTPVFRSKLTPLFRSKVPPVFRGKLTPPFWV